jgi:hypothetical protein
VFFGILRYKKFLKIFTDELFSSKKSTLDFHDEKLYYIIVYITIFRFDELSLEDYKSLIIVSYINI